MRMWEIRENDSYKYGRRGSMSGMIDSEEKAYQEGYECGFEEGYDKAMKEAAYSYGERGSYGERRMR